MKAIALPLLAAAAVLAACASGPPPATDFPPGARAPATGEITSLLRGKSFTLANPNGSTTRVDHADDARLSAGQPDPLLVVDPEDHLVGLLIGPQRGIGGE